MDLTVRIELGPWDEVRGKLSGESWTCWGYVQDPANGIGPPTSPSPTSSLPTESSPEVLRIYRPLGLAEKRVAVQTGDVAHDHLLKRGYSGEIVEFRTWEEFRRAS
jgi:hypothetical protein